MINCIECEIVNEYSCEMWGVCPNDDDFIEKLYEKLKEEIPNQ